MKQSTLRKMVPLPHSRVRIADSFWSPRVETNRTVTLPLEHEKCEATGRLAAWKLTWKPGMLDPPHYFWDSDVAKWLEAVGYSLATTPDPKLERAADKVIADIAAAQQPDGYVNIYFTTVAPEGRWRNLRDQHELYCAGHLMEAAVAYFEGTGKRVLLDVMCRYADYIGRVFGPRRGQKRGYPGHQEIELALVKLARAAGEERYLELAKFFVDERGRKPWYFSREAAARGEEAEESGVNFPYDYLQGHVPARDQETAEGHAVRACYYYSGMADVAAETGDRELFRACRRIWRNITERRMYITGATGSTRFGERFTFDYDLPNEEAYAETCANIALVFFAHRMLQVEADAQYADVMERALYNGVASGISLDGTRFFYDNILATHPDHHRFSGQKSPERQDWFWCACCPPNIARLLASLGGYVYSQSRSGIFVHLYAGGSASFDVGGTPVTIVQKTAYPWRERVRIAVKPDKPATFALALRIPGWCRGARLSVNGRPARPTLRKGYAVLRREWNKGDQVELLLPMPVERVEAHPSVRQAAGCVALQRGPVVYCLEEADNGADLADLTLPRSVPLRARFEREVFGGVVTVTGKARRRDRSGWGGRLYRAERSKTKTVPFKAVPYALWANRGLGEMRVWIRSDG